MKYQLTDEAARDVEEILEYTVINFGAVQAQHYFEVLKALLHLISNKQIKFSFEKKSHACAFAALQPLA